MCDVAKYLERHDPKGLVDGWKLLVTEEELVSTNERLGKYLSEKFAGQDIVIATILKGAAYMFVDLTRQITIPHSVYFIEASSYKNGQTQGEEIELLSKIIPSKFEGKKVILIDELYDNGATMFKVKAKILETVPRLKDEDIFTCVMFKKEKKTTYPPPDIVGMSLPNVWVVGYGLDDHQEKRNWIHLFAKPKDQGNELTADDQIFVDVEYYQRVRSTIQKEVYNY